ncbi:hypothetical protein GCM10022384_55190 [Streptomyces marokkonensis]|uniref:Uncharacterized protein n=1 Tax=Streptomyces marokkonensis TaxID=324855 RepID=A0ABP7RRG6_9ACTN
MLAGLLGPEPASDNRLPATAAIADSYDGFDTEAVEQLRRDQCLMADVLRLGGPAMSTLAQNGLNQSPEQLHVTANSEYWTDTPLALHHATIHNCMRDALLRILASAGFQVEEADGHAHGSAVHVTGHRA